MKEGTLLIEGKNYVSSARAAQLVGYTKDYVGQLARAGKIESKLIGRSWYVSEESITQHKLTVHYTLTKPKKPRQKNESDSISRISEKPIENKDISSKTNTTFEENVDVAGLGKGRFFVDDVQTQVDERDLYPTPRKRNVTNDPLIHSEIYYERFEEEHPSAYHENTQVEYVKEETPPTSKGVTLPVRLRTTAPKQQRASGDLREGFETPEVGRTKRAVMDGVIIPSSAPAPSHGHHPNREVYTTDPVDMPNDEYETDNYSPRLHTRSLAFLGAVVIVLVIVVLYSIFV
jgi:hypothetical protein